MKKYTWQDIVACEQTAIVSFPVLGEHEYGDMNLESVISEAVYITKDGVACSLVDGPEGEYFISLNSLT